MVDLSTQTAAPLAAITTFGEFLKFLRRRARMTQRELSIAVGYSISQISRLEQNERLPDEMTIRAVFVPALGLEKEPVLVARLVALAQSAHERPATIEPTPPAPPIPALSAEQPFADTLLRHNLPYQLTSFIGRAADCTAIVQRFATTRLVTLTGVGGGGKTRLALAVAQAILEASLAVPSANPKSKIQNPKFPDGIWFVELAPLHEAALVATAMLTTFQLPLLSGHALTAVLLSYLKQKQMLVVLDNCEHLIITCADLVDRILHTCPGVTILATSREALNVDGEVEWPVKPLTTPPLPHTPAIQLSTTQLRDFEAVQLFLDRAQTICADWQLTDQHVSAVAQICTHLDGIPLAIELAAARLKGLTVEEIAAHLDDRFTLLTSGRRSALLRHQTLRATIDWSYDLLSEPERRLLRRLGVFAGGWTVAAAEAVAGDAQAHAQTLPLLLQLVNKSLVVKDETGVESRYHMLETIRQYATEKLRAAGEADRVQRNHFAYFLALVEASWAVTLIGPRLSSWLNRIVMEYDNLRLAFAWACQQSDQGEGALRLAGTLGLFWVVRGEFSEGIRWLETALAQDQGAFPAERALVLARLADLAGMVGQPRIALIEEARFLFTEAHAAMGLGYCLHLLGANQHTLTPAQAIAILEQGVQIYRELAYPLGIGIALCKLGDAYRADGQTARALACYEECIAIGRQYSERLLMCRPLVMLTVVDRERALQICQAELQRPQPDPETQAALLHTFGRILEDHERFADAKTTLIEALGLWRKLGIKWSASGGITRALLDLGLICFGTKDDVASARYMTEAQQHYADVGDWHGVAWTQGILGNVALRQHQYEQALTYFQASLRYSVDYTINYSMNYLPLVLCGMAATLTAVGKPNAAFHLFGAATCFEDKLFALDVPVKAPFVQALADARECLTDPCLAAAWAEGQAMSVEQAVAYALAQPVGNDMLPPYRNQLEHM